MRDRIEHEIDSVGFESENIKIEGRTVLCAILVGGVREIGKPLIFEIRGLKTEPN